MIESVFAHSHARRARIRTFATRVEAEQFLARQKVDVAGGQWISPAAGRTTLATYSAGWMAVQPWRPATVDATTAVLARVHAAFGDRTLTSLRTSEIQAWALQLEDRYAPSTVEGTVRLLRAILRAAVADRVIARSPADGVRLRRREGAIVVPLTVEQVRALADAAPAGLSAAVVLTACTGLRQGELFGLTVDRVAWLKREIVVDRQLVTPSSGPPAFGPCKTSRSVRTVPVADHALAVLAEHVRRHGHGADGLLFHRDGKPWPRDRGAEAFKRLAKAAEVETSGWHALRHHCASVLIAAGLSVTAVAAVLGHSPAECLATYAHWWPSEHEQIRAGVAQAWERVADSTRTEPGAGH